VGYLRLIYCTAMLQFYQFQAECAFTQPSSSALEQMDWKLRQRRCWCLEAKEEFNHIFSLCWFVPELLSVFIFLLMSFAENLQYQRFCIVLILTSNVQLHLSTLQARFFFCFFSTL
jgi:hypothetical protein